MPTHDEQPSQRPLSLQKKATALKRQHVLEAAIAVFSEKGFRGATIRDIAVAAGVADGTIYNLFENKAALLRAILEARPGDNEPAYGSPTGAARNEPLPLRAMLAARWTALGDESLAMLRIVLAEALVDPEFRALYRDTLLLPAIAQMETPFTELTKSTSVELDSRLVTGLFMGLVMLRLLGDDVLNQRSDEVPDRLADFILRGLMPSASTELWP
jgi:AcrR family transcriptional regulator